MGKVYLAEDTKLDRKVALKFLPDYITDDSKARERFRNEARAAASLNHPNITQIHALEESDHGSFIVMEYVDGVELKKLIQRNDLSLERKKEIALEVSKALGTAHKKGIIHRDVKSSNIMIRDDGTVKVMDFGLARFIDSAHITRTGDTLGTAAYMAPEQILGNQVDERADIWSFGVVLYELLAGELPFRGEYEQAITYAILEDEPMPISEVGKEIPEPLQKMVDRCLRKQPEDRYDSFREIIDQFSDMGLTHGTDTTGSSQNIETPFKPSRKILYGGVSLILIVAAIWLLLPGGQPLPDNTGSEHSAIRQTLAVRPFKSIGADQQASFTQGMAEILNTNLAQVEGFRAISQNAVEHYLKSYTLPEIVEELGLDYLIEGSVQLFGEQVRINIQLMNAETSEYVWTNSYERYLGDALILQKEIAEDILQRIQQALGQEVAIQVNVDASRVKPEALKLYLKAVDYQKSRTRPDVSQSIELFKQSIAIDSTFSPAYARMAFSYILNVNFFTSEKNEPYIGNARRAIDKALELTPNSSWAYLSMGLIEEFSFNWEEAEEALNKAIAFNPANDEAHHELAHHLLRLGRFEEAIDSEMRALNFVPNSPLYQSGLGEIYLFRKDYDKAITEMKKALKLDPEHRATYRWLTKAYLHNGAFQQALVSLDKAITQIYTAERAQIYGLMGQAEKARKLIEQANNNATTTLENGFGLALAYAAIGDNEKAIDMLERAMDNKNTWLIYMKVEPGLDPLRNDPRYQAIERKVFGRFSSYSN